MICDMKKNLLFVALAGSLLAGCSSSDVETTYENEVMANRQVPVMFGTYLGNTADTRAGNGKTGAVTTANLKDKHFGVFAYYTKNADYATGGTPNFMYNEEVSFTDGTTWTYAPVKYWPNEQGAEGDSKGATSVNKNRVSFFAYAPFVGKDDGTNAYEDDLQETGKEVGITGFVANNATEDPYVTYRVATDAKNAVDLVWANAKNQTKKATTEKVTFTFNHALSRIQLMAQAAFDVVGGTASADPATADAQSGDLGTQDSATKIYINSVDIKAADMTVANKFNLATGKWSTVTADMTSAETTLSVAYDNVNTTLKSAAAGVTTTETAILAQVNSEDQYFMIIPKTEQQLEITIDYDIETTDPALAGKLSDDTTNGIKMNNVVTKTKKITFEAGKSYKLKLMIGLTDVEFSASVSDWTEATPDNVVWLPINSES